MLFLTHIKLVHIHKVFYFTDKKFVIIYFKILLLPTFTLELYIKLISNQYFFIKEPIQIICYLKTLVKTHDTKSASITVWNILWSTTICLVKWRRPCVRHRHLFVHKYPKRAKFFLTSCQTFERLCIKFSRVTLMALFNFGYFGILIVLFVCLNRYIYAWRDGHGDCPTHSVPTCVSEIVNGGIQCGVATFAKPLKTV